MKRLKLKGLLHVNRILAIYQFLMEYLLPFRFQHNATVVIYTRISFIKAYSRVPDAPREIPVWCLGVVNSLILLGSVIIWVLCFMLQLPWDGGFGIADEAAFKKYFSAIVRLSDNRPLGESRFDVILTFGLVVGIQVRTWKRTQKWMKWRMERKRDARKQKGRKEGWMEVSSVFKDQLNRTRLKSNLLSKFKLIVALLSPNSFLAVTLYLPASSAATLTISSVEK